MATPTRKNLFKLIEQRVIAGERKADIYAPYAKLSEAKRVARVLAQVPTPHRRAQFKRLNQLLMMVVALLALIKALSVLLIVRKAAIADGALLILLAPVLNIILIWVIGQFRGVGYTLTVVLGFTALSHIMQGFTQGANGYMLSMNVINLFGVLSSMVLAFILLKNLLPYTSFFLSPKKGPSGEPIFED
ncbi:hypothetical protein [Celerinatantimonas yamalensis]|uniref:Uncharacterized protein n=1 Tax=Celerinatantimonas yamalensis TaxID=559956 RepID=A0ABW9G707_9GAMM